MTMATAQHLVIFLLTLAWLSLSGRAYIPAVPTNISADIQAGINESDTSMLALQWYPNASFSQTVSYQLVGSESTGVNMGALVHFAEQNDTNLTTTIPWIAFISCDSNGTDFLLDEDVFTLAKDQGAVAALLYSKWSVACIINAEYADPATFDHVFDIFATKSLVTARTVENAFTNVNQMMYGDFNASTLNSSFDSINNTITTGHASPGYLFATLTAANASIPENGDVNSGSSNTSNSGGGGTDRTMIVLYVIIGVVSVLLCSVILSG